MTPMAEQALTTGRRRFLATLAAVAAASGVGARAVPAATRLTRVGVQLYTVRDLLQRDFEGTLARLAAIGFREVEFAHYHGHSPQPVRAVPWLLVRMATSEYGRLRQVESLRQVQGAGS